MNMLLQGVKDTEFGIFHGDTLTNDWEVLREPGWRRTGTITTFSGLIIPLWVR
jgi:type I restriction-modification system DNA methylase subunit